MKADMKYSTRPSSELPKLSDDECEFYDLDRALCSHGFFKYSSKQYHQYLDLCRQHNTRRDYHPTTYAFLKSVLKPSHPYYIYYFKSDPKPSHI